MTQPHLTIAVVLPDGHTPVSWLRMMDVGVGGTHGYCRIAQGQPVRRATLRELRRLDRLVVADYAARYPDARITWRRGRSR